MRQPPLDRTAEQGIDPAIRGALAVLAGCGLRRDGAVRLTVEHMMLAQRLYEGVEVGKESVGLITYMRTDSTRISDDAIRDVRDFIGGRYGKDKVECPWPSLGRLLAVLDPSCQAKIELQGASP